MVSSERSERRDVLFQRLSSDACNRSSTTAAALIVLGGNNIKPDCHLLLSLSALDIVSRYAEQGLPDDDSYAHEDHLAEIIRGLTREEAEKLWSVLIQLKPHLNDL